LTVFLATVVVAVIGYVLAGWQFLDAVYMVVITIFGVGYGEVRPLSPTLKVFTILVIIAGTSSAVYAVGGFLQLITEGEINRVLGARRMTRGIETLNQHVIICGFGHIGQILCQELHQNHFPFVVIDRDADKVTQAEVMGYLVRQGDATSEAVLLSVGIEKARVLATVLQNDAVNVFITLTARGLNPQLTIVARGEEPSTEKKLRLAGADQVVLPAAIGGLHMAHLITHPAAVDFLDQELSRGMLNEQLAQIDLQLMDLSISEHSSLVGKKLDYLEVRGRNSFLVIAIRRADGLSMTNPDRETILQAGDSVIVIGNKHDMPQLMQRLIGKREIKYRGAQL
jgi:voltage-gated potassium channel